MYCLHLPFKSLDASMSFWINDQTDSNKTAEGEWRVDKSEVTSLMLSEAFINKHPLENATNCFQKTLLHDGGGGGGELENTTQGVNLKLINTLKWSPGIKVDL